MGVGRGDVRPHEGEARRGRRRRRRPHGSALLLLVQRRLDPRARLPRGEGPRAHRHRRHRAVRAVHDAVAANAAGRRRLEQGRQGRPRHAHLARRRIDTRRRAALDRDGAGVVVEPVGHADGRARDLGGVHGVLAAERDARRGPGAGAAAARGEDRQRPDRTAASRHQQGRHRRRAPGGRVHHSSRGVLPLARRRRGRRGA